MIIGEGVDQVGGGHALGHAVAPAAGLDQIVEEQGDDVIRLDEGSVLVDNAEAVGVAIGGHGQVGARLPHLGPCVVQQLVGGLRSMAAEEHVAVIVNRLHGYARLA